MMSVVFRLVFFEDGVLRLFTIESHLVHIGTVVPSFAVLHAERTSSALLIDVITFIAIQYHRAGIRIVATSFPAKQALHR